MKLKIILAMQGSPPALAAANVLSMLFNVDCQVLCRRDIQQARSLHREAAIVLTENQLGVLAALRLHRFSGAALVLAADPPDVTIRKHPILFYGSSSHAVSQSPWLLTDLITQTACLAPPSPGNLDMLHQTLRIPVERLDRDVMPHFERLKQGHGNFQQALDEIQAQFSVLLNHTTLFRHETFDSGDPEPESPQIQEKFVAAIAALSSVQDRERKQQLLLVLERIFERWREHVLATGEGLEDVLNED